MKFKELKEGQVYFKLGKNHICFQYKYLGDGLFKEVGSMDFLKDNDASNLYETEYEAKIKYYKFMLGIKTKDIIRLEQDIKCKKNIIKKLNDKFGYLKELHPELFI